MSEERQQHLQQVTDQQKSLAEEINQLSSSLESPHNFKALSMSV